jgi:hypothetical protein
VLQIFLEKIIDCIGRIQKQIKEMTQKQLLLWSEETCYYKNKKATKPIKRSSSADSGLLITTTTTTGTNSNASN